MVLCIFFSSVSPSPTPSNSANARHGNPPQPTTLLSLSVTRKSEALPSPEGYTVETFVLWSMPGRPSPSVGSAVQLSSTSASQLGGGIRCLYLPLNKRGRREWRAREVISGQEIKKLTVLLSSRLSEVGMSCFHSLVSGRLFSLLWFIKRRVLESDFVILNVIRRDTQ